ncbi:unnamed protein product [Boreogadus saida]
MDFLRTLVTFLSLVSAKKANLVKESKSSPCCGSPEIEDDAPKDCEQTWVSERKIIAEYHPDHPPVCLAPCSSVSSGKLGMHRCLPVTLIMICLDSKGNVELEKITNYTETKDNCLTPAAIAKSVASPRYSFYGLVPAPLLCVFTLICLGI